MTDNYYLLYIQLLILLALSYMSKLWRMTVQTATGRTYSVADSTLV